MAVCRSPERNGHGLDGPLYCRARPPLNRFSTAASHQIANRVGTIGARRHSSAGRAVPSGCSCGIDARRLEIEIVYTLLRESLGGASDVIGVPRSRWRRRPWVSRTVLCLGLTSLFTDISSE